MTGAELALLSGLGGVIGLDTVSFPQAMLSRPLVGATLAGWLMGAPATGLLVGVLGECFALDTLPVGASRYPEWGSASVVAGSVAAVGGARSPAPLVWAILTLLALGWAGGWTMVQTRRLNAHWARQRHEAVARGARRVVTGLQLYGLTADLLRGVAVTLAGLLLFVPAGGMVYARWQVPDVVSLGTLVAAAVSVAGGAVWKTFHGVPGFRWLALGGFGVAVVVVVL